jgi:hypothetical protein
VNYNNNYGLNSIINNSLFFNSTNRLTTVMYELMIILPYSEGFHGNSLTFWLEVLGASRCDGLAEFCGGVLSVQM